MAMKAGRVGVDKFNVDPKTGKVKSEIDPSDLPVATPSTLGAVKPVAKDEGMTQDVGVDSNGKLYTKPGEGYVLPVATPSALGGVKPVDKTEGMTQDVGVDANGGLFTAAGGGKVYYKIYTPKESPAYSDRIEVSGYTPIAAIPYSDDTGYSGKCWLFSPNIGTNIFYLYGEGEFLSHSPKAKVFFIKNSDLQSL